MLVMPPGDLLGKVHWESFYTCTGMEYHGNIEDTSSRDAAIFLYIICIL